MPILEVQLIWKFIDLYHSTPFLSKYLSKCLLHIVIVYVSTGWLSPIFFPLCKKSITLRSFKILPSHLRTVRLLLDSLVPSMPLIILQIFGSSPLSLLCSVRVNPAYPNFCLTKCVWTGRRRIRSWSEEVEAMIHNGNYAEKPNKRQTRQWKAK